MENEDLNVN